MQLSISESFLKMIERIQRTDYAVLVESVAPIRTAVVCTVNIEFSLPRLGRNGVNRVDRVLITHAPNDSVRPDLPVIVQRYAVLLLRIKALQDVHIIRDRNVAPGIAGNMIVP